MKAYRVFCGLFSAVVLSLALAALPACGGSGGGGGGGDIVVTPGTAVLAKGATQQFVATQNSVDVTDDVDWSVSAGGGSFDGEPGLFSTPSSLPADNVITVTATSGDDSGTAEVTLTVGASVTFTEKTNAPTTSADEGGILLNTQGVAYDDANHEIYLTFTDIAMDGGSPVVLDSGTYVYKSADAGDSWDDPAGNLLSEDLILIVPQSIFDSEGDLNLAYLYFGDGGSNYVGSYLSDDGAANFSDVAFPDGWDDKGERPYLAAAESGSVFMVQSAWNDDDLDYKGIYLWEKEAGDSENTWIGELNNNFFDGDNSTFDCPSIAMDGEDVVAMYTKRVEPNPSTNYNRDIYLQKYSDGEIQDPVKLSPEPGKTFNPYLVIDSEGVYHIIATNFDDTGDDEETDEIEGSLIIIYSKSTDGGETFLSVPEIIYTWEDVAVANFYTLMAYRPVMAFDEVNGVLYAAFYLSDGLYVAVRDDTGWSEPEQLVSSVMLYDLNSEMGSAVSIAVDSAGRVYVAGGVPRTEEILFEMFFAIGE